MMTKHSNSWWWGAVTLLLTLFIFTPGTQAKTVYFPESYRQQGMPASLSFNLASPMFMSKAIYLPGDPRRWSANARQNTEVLMGHNSGKYPGKNVWLSIQVTPNEELGEDVQQHIAKALAKNPKGANSNSMHYVTAENNGFSEYVNIVYWNGNREKFHITIYRPVKSGKGALELKIRGDLIVFEDIQQDIAGMLDGMDMGEYFFPSTSSYLSRFSVMLQALKTASLPDKSITGEKHYQQWMASLPDTGQASPIAQTGPLTTIKVKDLPAGNTIYNIYYGKFQTLHQLKQTGTHSMSKIWVTQGQYAEIFIAYHFTYEKLYGNTASKRARSNESWRAIVTETTTRDGLGIIKGQSTSAPTYVRTRYAKKFKDNLDTASWSYISTYMKGFEQFLQRYHQKHPETVAHLEKNIEGLLYGIYLDRLAEPATPKKAPKAKPKPVARNEALLWKSSGKNITPQKGEVAERHPEHGVAWSVPHEWTKTALTGRIILAKYHKGSPTKLRLSVFSPEKVGSDFDLARATHRVKNFRARLNKQVMNELPITIGGNAGIMLADAYYEHLTFLVMAQDNLWKIDASIDDASSRNESRSEIIRFFDGMVFF